MSAVDKYLACLLRVEAHNVHTGRPTEESCLRRFERRLRWDERRYGDQCPEVDATRIAELASKVADSVAIYVDGEQDLLDAVHEATARPSVSPTTFNLQSGTSTVTGPYPGGAGACGADQEWINQHYGSSEDPFWMVAVPAAFFEQFQETGNVKCKTPYPNIAVNVPEEGEPEEPLCYRLSAGDVELKVIVADVCAGNCAANVAQCLSASPNPTCGTVAQATCLDCGTSPQAITKQFEEQWRCPPAMDCFEQANPGQHWQDYTGEFLASTMGITPTSQCVTQSYVPSGDYPNGRVDWCSGENAHFDIQNGVPFNSLGNPQVITYERIPCS
ncbi:MAG: hypothetical protein AAF637_08350 [Pseudomonadota bacterium]